MSLLETPLKRCGKCGETKALDCFGKFHRAPDGLNHKCKACVRQQGKEWRDANKEKEAARCAAWRKANPEKRKAVVAAYCEQNRETLNAKSREAYAANAEKQQARSREKYSKNRERYAEWAKAWAAANPERVREKGRAWAERNPDKIREKCSRRRAKARKLPWYNELDIMAVYREARKLSRITGVKHEVDHIYPLKSNLVSGLHVAANLKAVPADVNRKKKNQLPGSLSAELWDPASAGVFHG